ncbi:hypothetical protein L5F43_09855 [Aliarcobacter butzleri]|uniref:hypothetical protein n=1 Tax=Aliarcobacter butzleri TaxID=28197 RepID=UPI001EDAB4A8|nr:hypothetical protein [Aliarcobacter butzleri]MCG3688482.1 hypothetical protein [Aliarcobacter butzleri]MCG3706781.1 hypothetical protein [Aliarcobacter butzleri]MCT7557329.1 hypothetical protein [Aliarcobacter butzleri]MCT7557407.1 hypothetical protein [Aliarcobacter butzleri]MCT7592434.1 hypothetical protein [Aliarcobacter butzleri]
MIEITIDVTNATEKEIVEINKIYEKPINQLSKDATIFYKDDNAIRKDSFFACGGIGRKAILVFQSMEDLKLDSKETIEND